MEVVTLIIIQRHATGTAVIVVKKHVTRGLDTINVEEMHNLLTAEIPI